MSESTRLRLSDGPTTEVSAVIDASPEELWAFVSDVNLSARFSPEFQGAEWLGGASGPALGAQFRGTNEHRAIGSWQVTCSIVELEPNRLIGWSVHGPDGLDPPAASWRFELEPVDAGTRVTQWVRLGPGGSGLSPAIERMPDREHEIIERRLAEHRSNMDANLVGLAQLVTG